MSDVIIRTASTDGSHLSNDWRRDDEFRSRMNRSISINSKALRWLTAILHAQGRAHGGSLTHVGIDALRLWGYQGGRIHFSRRLPDAPVFRTIAHRGGDRT